MLVRWMHCTLNLLGSNLPLASRPSPPQIATLETGVINIKSVLTRNTDPGLIAMTGVINLLVGGLLPASVESGLFC